MIQEITYKDWELLLEWRNHPSVRTASISTSVINVEEHKAYIKHLVDREDRIQYFYVVDSIKVGYIRADYNKDGTELSYVINPDQQGKGYGKRMMSEYLKTISGNYYLHIKESNIASIKLAEYNGFTLDSKDGNILKFKNKVMSDLEIIDAVEEARKGNNTNWMDLVRLAFEVAPEKARPIFAKINDGDGNISQLLDQLAKNG